MPRKFTRSDLATLTLTDYAAMSVEDQRAYDLALWAMWEANEAAWLAGDYDRRGSIQRYEIGE